MDQKTASQFGRFLLVGVANTIVDVSTYFALTRSIPFLGEHLSIGKAISYIIALTFSYTINSLWTFKKSLHHRRLLSFYMTVGMGIFINIGVHYIVLNILGINDLIAVLIAAAGTALWGFSFAKFVVFRD